MGLDGDDDNDSKNVDIEFGEKQPEEDDDEYTEENAEIQLEEDPKKQSYQSSFDSDHPEMNIPLNKIKKN